MASRSLDSLDPRMRPLVDAFLQSCTEAGLDVLVTCCFRSVDEQTTLYAQGRSTPGSIVTDAQAGQSAHNYGLAVDIVPIVNGKPDWNGTHPVWQQVGALGEAAGLDWAGRWVTFRELPHFQIHDWKQLAGIST